MSWVDRLAELRELFIGLGIGAVVLTFVTWLISVSGYTDRDGKGAQRKPRSGQPSPEKSSTEDRAKPAPPTVVAIYIAPSAGMPMEQVDRATAIARRGLAGDRYFLEKGHWSGTDDCEVTIIAQEDIDGIERQSGVQIQNGQHRRNIVIRNLPIETLAGKRFRIGSASFGYDRPRPPCAYIRLVSEPGMAKALGKRAGICVRCITGGVIQEGDRIATLNVTLPQALKYRTKVMLKGLRSRTRRHE